MSIKKINTFLTFFKDKDGNISTLEDSYEINIQMARYFNFIVGNYFTDFMDIPDNAIEGAKSNLENIYTRLDWFKKDINTLKSKPLSKKFRKELDRILKQWLQKFFSFCQFLAPKQVADYKNSIMTAAWFEKEILNGNYKSLTINHLKEKFKKFKERVREDDIHEIK